MPERVLIGLEDVFLTFGGKPLFEDLRMHISEGDKICLVGRNGAGKTTLMRIITGELELDGGKRFALPGITIGYLAQTVRHTPGETVHAFVLSGLAPADRTEEKHHMADIIIEPLDLAPGAVMDSLSGGQLRRAALARALIAEPDLLLLDEPTNHLDLAAIEWLEQYLAAYRGALVCVSHDRAFLTAISRKVFWIDHGAIRVCPTGYGGFEDWAEQIIELEARALKNAQKKLAAEVDWTQGGVTGRRKRNQRRLNELHRLRDKLKADKAAHTRRRQAIELEQLAPAQASKVIVEFKHVYKSFEREGQSLPILQDFNLRILRGDRIGILGRNGSGKSTFLKLLTGEMEPDKGTVKRGKTVEIAYFDQNRTQLNPNKTLWDTLCPEGGDYVFLGHDKERAVHVCGYLKNFLFDPKMARDRVSTLSGGQQNRLMLARLLASPGNVLILDEPTNDLDMDTLDMLQELLAEYQGTLLVVSHDRDFLERTVTEVLAFEGNAKVESTIGGYSDYQAARRKTLQKEEKTTHTNAPPAVNTQPLALSGKQKHELEKLPARIAKLEKELEGLREQLQDPEFYSRNHETFDRASRRFGIAQMELETLEARWLELEELRQKAEVGNY